MCVWGGGGVKQNLTHYDVVVILMPTPINALKIKSALLT